ncbi:hypothetical protein Tco_0110585 [Tanacetum coccineum]
MVILLKKQVGETQHAEETVATADATQSLKASESAEDQVNQPKTAEAEKLMDEIDQKNKVAQEQPESSYDTESEIKIIKRFQSSQPDDDAQITSLGAELLNFEYDQTKSTRHGDSDSDFGVRSMSDDELASLTCFKTPNSADNDSKEGTAKTSNASADMPAQSDPLGHLHEELHTLNTKVDQLESSISKKVTDDIQSFVPSIVEYPPTKNASCRLFTKLASG